jgi:ABC-type antimicrobial peptide transport system permease subunit
MKTSAQDLQSNQPVTAAFSSQKPRYSEWRRFWRVLFSRKIVIIGVVIFVLNIIAAIFAPLLAPYDP